MKGLSFATRARFQEDLSVKLNLDWNSSALTITITVWRSPFRQVTNGHTQQLLLPLLKNALQGGISDQYVQSLKLKKNVSLFSRIFLLWTPCIKSTTNTMGFDDDGWNAAKPIFQSNSVCSQYNMNGSFFCSIVVDLKNVMNNEKCFCGYFQDAED